MLYNQVKGHFEARVASFSNGHADLSPVQEKHEGKSFQLVCKTKTFLFSTLNTLCIGTCFNNSFCFLYNMAKSHY